MEQQGFQFLLSWQFLSVRDCSGGEVGPADFLHVTRQAGFFALQLHKVISLSSCDCERATMPRGLLPSLSEGELCTTSTGCLPLSGRCVPSKQHRAMGGERFSLPGVLGCVFAVLFPNGSSEHLFYHLPPFLMFCCQ